MAAPAAQAIGFDSAGGSGAPCRRPSGSRRSPREHGPAPDSVFAVLHQQLAAGYPRVHSALAREVLGGSLLFTWRGADTTVPAIVLTGHLDVVPVDSGSEGAVDPSAVRGRRGRRRRLGPRRAGRQGERARDSRGDRGAPGRGLRAGAHDVSRLRPRRGDPRASAGRCGSPGAPGSAARGWSGCWTKAGRSRAGSCRALRAAGGGRRDRGEGVRQPGAAWRPTPAATRSTPPAHTAIGRLARAVSRLEAEPFPARIAGATGALLEHTAPEMSLPFQARVRESLAARAAGAGAVHPRPADRRGGAYDHGGDDGVGRHQGQRASRSRRGRWSTSGPFPATRPRPWPSGCAGWWTTPRCEVRRAARCERAVAGVVAGIGRLPRRRAPRSARSTRARLWRRIS